MDWLFFLIPISFYSIIFYTEHVKNVQDEELPHELFLRTRKKKQKRNTFTNNMLIDTKLSKKLSKLIQSGWFLGALLDKLVGPLMKDCASASAIDGAIQRVLHQKGTIATSRASVVRAGKGITLIISN